MKTRFLTVASVVLACVMMGLNSGCKGDDPENLGFTPIGDDGGGLLGIGSDGSGAYGGRFEDKYTRVTNVSFEPVYFAFDSYALAPNEIAKIDLVARHMQSTKNHYLVIEGHCDARGSNEYNLSLGEYRAQGIRSYLTRLGIAEDRIQTRSYGSEKPAVQGSGEVVWSKNRRGEFALYQ